MVSVVCSYLSILEICFTVTFVWVSLVNSFIHSWRFSFDWCLTPWIIRLFDLLLAYCSSFNSSVLALSIASLRLTTCCWSVGCELELRAEAYDVTYSLILVSKSAICFPFYFLYTREYGILDLFGASLSDYSNQTALIWWYFGAPFHFPLGVWLNFHILLCLLRFSISFSVFLELNENVLCSVSNLTGLEALQHSFDIDIYRICFSIVFWTDVSDRQVVLCSDSEPFFYTWNIASYRRLGRQCTQ